MKKHGFKVGDSVKISSDGLVKHSRGVPAHMGYSQATIDWRNSILKIEKAGLIGKVTRIASDDNINVEFDETCYGVDSYMIEKVS